MPLLAVIERGLRRLLLLRFDGSIAFEIPAPLREGSPEWVAGGYDDCLFDESGRYLWCAVAVSTDQIDFQLRETDGRSVVSRTLVDTVKAPCHYDFIMHNPTISVDGYTLMDEGKLMRSCH